MQKVKTGQKFSVKAETWNSFIDAAEFIKRQQANTNSTAPRKDTKSGVVMLRNNTGAALEQFKVVSVGNLIITPEDNEQEFRNTLPVFEVPRYEYSFHYSADKHINLRGSDDDKYSDDLCSI